jgi:RNA polymerase sigma-54 factor
MTPQLQQAIRLLQLSTVELQAEIQQALESNPMLENQEDADQSSDSEFSSNDSDKSGDASSSSDDSGLDMKADQLPQDLPVDSNWEDTYDVGVNYSSYQGTGGDDNNRDFENRSTESESLQDYLTWQLQLTPFSDSDMAIATAVVDSVNEDGYLTTSAEDIQEQLGDEFEVELDEIEAVIHRVQNFDPPGVAARDLRESLLIQLKQTVPADTAWFDQAKRLLEDHFALLANRDFNQLMRRLKVDEDGLRETVKLIHSLNPRPGSSIASSQAEYIVPDVYVRKEKGKWIVSLNPESTPKLQVNSLYASYIQRANKSADNTYLQSQLQEARWLIKSLQSRNETLLKVATCIVERQQAFLETGEEAMKALVLHDVAESVGMHESTISRITNKKYMHTPRGIFELKYFFSSHVSTASGGECSSTAIRALIKKMVAAEDARKPLSDSKIAKILSEQGINVARRTVAKYRDAMAIPPSNERKRIA